MKNLFNRSAILVIAAIAAAFCAPRIASGQCAIIAPNVGGAPGLNIIPPANPGCSGDVFIAVCAYTAGFSMRLHNFTTDVISGPLSVSGCSGGYGCGYNCVYRGFTGITPGAYAIYMYTDPFNDTVPCVSFPFEMPSHEPNDVMTLTLDGTNSVIPAEPCQTGLLKVNCGIPTPNCLNPPTGRCYLNDQPNGPWIDGVLTNGQLVFAGLPAADNYFVVASAANSWGSLGDFLLIPNPLDLAGCPSLGGTPSTEDYDPESGFGMISGSAPTTICADVNVSIQSETMSYGVEWNAEHTEWWQFVDAPGNYLVTLSLGAGSVCEEEYNVVVNCQNLGDPCDDGNAETYCDQVNTNCVCAGQPLTLQLEEDENSQYPVGPCEENPGWLQVNWTIPAPNCLPQPQAQLYLNSETDDNPIPGQLLDGVFRWDNVPASNNYFVTAHAGDLTAELSISLSGEEPCPNWEAPVVYDISPFTGLGVIRGTQVGFVVEDCSVGVHIEGPSGEILVQTYSSSSSLEWVAPVNEPGFYTVTMTADGNACPYSFTVYVGTLEGEPQDCDFGFAELVYSEPQSGYGSSPDGFASFRMVDNFDEFIEPWSIRLEDLATEQVYTGAAPTLQDYVDVPGLPQGQYFVEAYVHGMDCTIPGVVLHIGCADGYIVYEDTDVDGYGNADAPFGTCTWPIDGGHYAENDLDCDDGDETVGAAAIYRMDHDGDGAYIGTDVPYCGGELAEGLVPAAEATVPGDCNDNDSSIHPYATEVCDDIDNDCNGLIDADDPLLAGGYLTWCRDEDGDTFGNFDDYTIACSDPGAPWVNNGDDCDDTNPAIHPDALEICDGIDNDCDGVIDGDDLDVPSEQEIALSQGASDLPTDPCGTGWVEVNFDVPLPGCLPTPTARISLADGSQIIGTLVSPGRFRFEGVPAAISLSAVVEAGTISASLPITVPVVSCPALGGPPIVSPWLGDQGLIGATYPDLPCGPVMVGVVFDYGGPSEQVIAVQFGSEAWNASVSTPGMYHVTLSIGAGTACLEAYDVYVGPSSPCSEGCNDNDDCTTDDCVDNVCVHTPITTDTDGDGTPDCSDNCSTVSGQQGSACDDGNALTINDALDAGCTCVGTAVSCVGSGDCNDDDDCTGDECVNNVCAHTPNTTDTDEDGVPNCSDNCPTVAGQQGSACDDGIPTTAGDVLNGQCQCVGDPLDCAGLPSGTNLPGTACDDGDTCTPFSIWSIDCDCVGNTLDSDGDGVCDALDGCPVDPNKTGPGTCGCGVPDTDTDGDGLADCNDPCPNLANLSPGNLCNDGQASTLNDAVNADCVCTGDPDSDVDGTPDSIDPCPNLANLSPGDPCNDGQASTLNDAVNAACVCTGELDSDGDGTPDSIDPCPNLANLSVGDPCDDGQANTIDDVVITGCVCQGTPVIPCTENLTLSITLDAFPQQTTWTLYQADLVTALYSGGPYSSAQAGTLVQENLCLLAGTYHLEVYDSGGDGIIAGGYVLRNALGGRIIDASAGSFTAASAIGPPGDRTFSVPLGNTALTTATCDLANATPNTVIRATINPAVSAVYGPSNSTAGYQWWFFDPHGTYQRRISLTHANSNAPYLTGVNPAVRCSYLMLSAVVTNPLPLDVPLNVRVRSFVNNTYAAFGPACRLLLPTPPCPVTQLTTTSNPQVSCGASGLTRQGAIWADPVVSATNYRFEFTRTGYVRQITVPARKVLLSFLTNPLAMNNCYNVRVQVSFDGGNTWCPYGPSCTIALGNADCGTQGMAQGSSSNDVLPPEARMELWPNPLDGRELRIALSEFDAANGPVRILFFDATGRQAYQTSMVIEDGRSNSANDLPVDLPAGLYLVSAQAGEQRICRRLLLER